MVEFLPIRKVKNLQIVKGRNSALYFLTISDGKQISISISSNFIEIPFEPLEKYFLLFENQKDICIEVMLKELLIILNVTDNNLALLVQLSISLFSRNDLVYPLTRISILNGFVKEFGTNKNDTYFYMPSSDISIYRNGNYTFEYSLITHQVKISFPDNTDQHLEDIYKHVNDFISWSRNTHTLLYNRYNI